jgi:hypothetical protein
MNVNEMSLTELKSAAYDAIAHREHWQQQLNVLNKAIAEKQQLEQTKKLEGELNSKES